MRTDIHCPSQIEPAKYTYITSYMLPGADLPFGVGVEYIRKLFKDIIENKKTWFGSMSNCGVCGAHFRTGDLWQHENGDYVFLGHNCAEKYSMWADRSEFDGMKGRAIVAAERAAARRKTWAAIRSTLKDYPGLGAALKVQHRITLDIRARFMQFGTISEKQAELVFKLAAPKAPEKPKAASKSGRIAVECTVLATKTQDGAYGPSEKMLIEVPGDGGVWKAWGSVPSALSGEVRGMRIKMTATFEVAANDPSFAYFKRPAKVEVLP